MGAKLEALTALGHCGSKCLQEKIILEQKHIIQRTTFFYYVTGEKYHSTVCEILKLIKIIVKY